MPKTRAELVDEALTRLGALSAGQEPGAEDYAYVDGKVEPMLSDLAARDIAYASPSSIPDEAFDHLGAVLAYRAKDYFGVVGDEAASMLQSASLAERNLQFLSRGRTTRQRVQAEYF
jgi:hypothetical protein